jgi:putative transposase
MNFLHKESFGIIRDNQVIVLEDLKVKNMVQNHKLAKAISEVSWGMFRQLIEYKADWYGREVIIAPSNYASSQLCSDCGNKSSQTKDLSCRTYICQECGLEIDRDYNASLNLLKLAM